MKNSVFIATSIDGFIAKKDGGIDWLLELPNPEGSDFGFADFMRGIDAIVMGRNTYEFAASLPEWLYEKPVIVLSKTMNAIPDKLIGKIELLNAQPSEVVKRLNSRQYNNLYIDGGKTIQNFLAEDLIDELIITRIPILLGEGIPLFANSGKEQKFIHLKTEIFNNSLVKSHYKKQTKET
jgi:dihydrofolate reductase